MSAPLLPMPDAIYKTLLEALDELDDAFRPDAESVNARNWVHDLARQWPSMPDLPDGKDMFSQFPVSGE